MGPGPIFTILEMRAVIQRVLRANVSVGGETIAAIGKGLLLLIGIGKGDARKDIEYLAGKIVNLRIFEDDSGKMNLNIKQVSGEILSIPQFTLFGDVRKGNRPGFDRAGPPETAVELWHELNGELRKQNIPVVEGRFGAHMQVELINDGPVTLWIDTSEQG